jgi:hypothetical protein
MLDDERAIKEKAEIIEECSFKAKDLAKNQKWDMNLVVFMFAILLLTVILLFEGVDPLYLAPIAFFGLAMTWFVSRRQEKRLYRRHYRREIKKYYDSVEDEEPEG